MVAPITVALMPGAGYHRQLAAPTRHRSYPIPCAKPPYASWFPPAGGFRVEEITIPPERTPGAVAARTCRSAVAEIETKLPGLVGTSIRTIRGCTGPTRSISSTSSMAAACSNSTAASRQSSTPATIVVQNRHPPRLAGALRSARARLLSISIGARRRAWPAGSAPSFWACVRWLHGRADDHELAQHVEPERRAKHHAKGDDEPSDGYLGTPPTPSCSTGRPAGPAFPFCAPLIPSCPPLSLPASAVQRGLAGSVSRPLTSASVLRARPRNLAGIRLACPSCLPPPVFALSAYRGAVGYFSVWGRHPAMQPIGTPTTLSPSRSSLDILLAERVHPFSDACACATSACRRSSSS